MKNRIEDLLQERAKLVAENRSLLDKAESENRALLSEEQTEYERRDSKLNEIEGRISILKEQRERERSLTDGEAVETREVSDAESEYRTAFEAWAKNPASIAPEQRELLETETRANELVKGTSADGGYAVPVGFWNKFIEFIEQGSAIRQAGATVLQTDTGADLQVPKVTAHAAASYVAEAAQISNVKDTFSQQTLKAFKAAKLELVSWELLQDSAFDLESYLAKELARAVNARFEQDFMTGASNSTTTPKGLMTSATVGVTAASATAITADEIIGLIHSVAPQYRTANSALILHDSTLAAVRKLKDSAGQYLWQPSYQAGVPDRLLGYKVFIDPYVDGSLAANDLAAVFGDISAYVIRQVNGMTVQRLTERYADYGLVGFLGWARMDGALVDTNAVKSLKMAAS